MRWPAEFEATSSHRFRSGDDMQYSFAYFYYLMHARRERLPQDFLKELDNDADGFISDNELYTLMSAPPVPAAVRTVSRFSSSGDFLEARRCYQIVLRSHLNAWRVCGVGDGVHGPGRVWPEHSDNLEKVKQYALNDSRARLNDGNTIHWQVCASPPACFREITSAPLPLFCLHMCGSLLRVDHGNQPTY
jgi:hypothetical protein